MKQTELSELPDPELAAQQKNSKTAAITNAVFIGAMMGIVIFSIVKNGVGFFILIPLFIAYKLYKNSKKDKVQ